MHVALESWVCKGQGLTAGESLWTVVQSEKYHVTGMWCMQWGSPSCCTGLGLVKPSKPQPACMRMGQLGPAHAGS